MTHVQSLLWWWRKFFQKFSRHLLLAIGNVLFLKHFVVSALRSKTNCPNSFTIIIYLFFPSRCCRFQIWVSAKNFTKFYDSLQTWHQPLIISSANFVAHEGEKMVTIIFRLVLGERLDTWELLSISLHFWLSARDLLEFGVHGVFVLRKREEKVQVEKLFSHFHHLFQW